MNDNIETVRMGLINYIGSIATLLKGNKVENSHVLNAIIGEEALKLSKELSNGNLYDLTSFSPILKACSIFLENRKENLENLNISIEDYDYAIRLLNSLTNKGGE